MNVFNGTVVDLMQMIQGESEYFDWLVSQIEIRNGKSYHDVLERLYNTEFVWIVPNDDNRVQDGLDLRIEFKKSLANKMEQGVSVLEVLVALSRRVAFTAGGEAPYWAWLLFRNLKLNRFSDSMTSEKAERVEHILEDLIWRTYRRDGRGGFFPLNNAIEDQRKVEIWYQMNTYVMEIQEP